MSFMLAGMDVPIPDSRPVTLSEIAAQLPRLEIACTRCARRERFFTDQLIAGYGRDKPLVDLLRELSAGCFWRDPLPRQNGCGAYFPGLEQYGCSLDRALSPQ